MVNGAIGGSTNAVVHSLAIAGRLGVELNLDDWDRLVQRHAVPRELSPPANTDGGLFYAGGLPAVIKEIGDHLHKDALTVNGQSIWENSKDAVCYDRNVIFEKEKPFKDPVVSLCCAVISRRPVQS